MKYKNLSSDKFQIIDAVLKGNAKLAKQLAENRSNEAKFPYIMLIKNHDGLYTDTATGRKYTEEETNELLQQYAFAEIYE